MATEKREVELIIKANNLSNKTLKEVTAAVDGLSESLDQQVEAAKKGEASLADLSRTYKKIEDAGRALISQDALIKRFNDVAAAVAAADQKARRARDAYEALGSEQAALSTVTKKQDAELARLARSADAADKALAKQRGTLSALSGELSAIGVDTNRLETSQSALVSAAEKLSTAQRSASSAMETYTESVLKAKAAEKELGETQAFQRQLDEAARLNKAAEYVRFWTEALDKAEAEERQMAAASARAAAEIAHTEQILAKTRADEAKAAAAFRSQSDQAAKLVRDAEYIRFWSEALDKAEAEEKQLAEQLKLTNKEIDAQAVAAKRAGQAAAVENPFESNGRTTLSLMQRIRGEILALTAAYVGLQGAIQGAAGVLEAVKTEQQIQSKLLVMTGGDAKAAATEYLYLREQAERLGVALPDLAKNYTSFGIAAKQANLNSKDTRFIFEKVAEAGRVLHSSSDDMQGIFKAIEQMVSKGQVMSEELKGQLGDRLPGALQYAAKQYGVSTKEFIKQLEKGNVDAQTGVLAIARGLGDAFGSGLQSSLQGINAKEERFKTALYDFKLLIANAGFEEAYKQLLDKLTEFFKSDEGAKFAQDIAEAFTSVAKALTYVVENLQTFETIAQAIVGLYLARQFFNMAIGAAQFKEQLILMNSQLTVARGLVATLQRAFLLLTSFIAGWEIGKILADKFEIVRQLGVSLVVGLNSAWIAIKYGAQIAWESILHAWEEIAAKLLNSFTSTFRRILDLQQRAAKSIGQDKAAEAIGQLISSITVTPTTKAQNRVKDLTAQMKKELQQVHDIGFEMFQEASDANRAAARVKPPRAAPTATGESNPNAPTKFGPNTDALEKYRHKYEEILGEIESIEASFDRKEKDNLDARLKAVDEQYAKLFRKIKDLGGKNEAELTARLQKDIALLKAQITEKYNKEQLDKIESIQKRFAELETKLGKSKMGTLEDRNKAIDDSFKPLYADIAELDAQRQGNLKQQLDTMIAQLKVVEEQKFNEQQLAEAQKTTNELISARDSQITTINDEVKAGLLTEQQGREKVKQVIEATQPQIEAVADESIAMAEALRGLVDDAKLDQFIAKMELAKASAKGIKTEVYSAAEANQDLANGAVKAFDSASEAIGNAVAGVGSWKDAILATKRAFINFAAEFLRKIATMILQQTILNALQGSGSAEGGFGGLISKAVGAIVAHDGAVVGDAGGRSRAVSASWFTNAPRYHGGGIPGLAPSEYAAVLKKGEEVLTTDDPRNVLNGALAGGGKAAPVVQDVKVVNTIDSGSFVSEGLSTPEGTRAIFNFIRANRTQLKTVLG